MGIHSVKLQKGSTTKTVQVGSKSYDKYLGQGYTMIAGSEKNAPKNASVEGKLPTTQTSTGDPLKDLSIALAKGAPVPAGTKNNKGEDVGGTVQSKPSPTLAPSVQPYQAPTKNITPTIKFDPAESATRINNFNAALNVAVSTARAERQDKTLDFLKGVVPPGALPATSFAGVLNAFDASSGPLESSLISSASGFAQEQERNRFDIAQQEFQLQKDAQDAAEAARNTIRDLALSVGTAGGDQASVDSILALAESGDIDSAISAAAAALSSQSKEEIRQIGSNLVKVDDDGNVEVLFSADAQKAASRTTSGGGGGGTTSSVPRSSVDISGGINPIKSKMADVKTQVKEMFATGFANKIISELTDEELRLFMQDYIDVTNELQASIDPESFYTEWKASLGIDNDTGGGGGGGSLDNPWS